MPAEVAAAESGGHRSSRGNLRNLRNLWPPLQQISPEHQLSSTCSVLDFSGNMFSTDETSSASATSATCIDTAATYQSLWFEYVNSSLAGILLDFIPSDPNFFFSTSAEPPQTTSAHLISFETSCERLFLEEVTEEVAEVHLDPPVQFPTTPGHFLIIPLLTSPYSRLTQPGLFFEEVMEEATEEVVEVHSDPPVQFVTTPGHLPPHNLLCKVVHGGGCGAARVQRRKRRASYPIWVRLRLTNRSRYLRFRNPLRSLRSEDIGPVWRPIFIWHVDHKTVESRRNIGSER
ncbi:hypothetical protein B0H13DRAFT_1905564 [Mycena leptocephala]|nr:hypothetical protein B0H13DRAFT_1905564 [Mycena leptocephala]